MLTSWSLRRVRSSAAPSQTHLSASSRTASTSVFKNDLSPLMKNLLDDSPNLFSEQGMDVSAYSEQVDFQDPITNYSDIQGFRKNLAFLKAAFNPTYDMLDIRQINELQVEARWTMGFDVLPIKNSPLGKYWQPRMEFTGTTIYGTDQDTGEVVQHLDTWDCVQNQKYFSTEAFADVLSQICDLQLTPDLQSPEFTLMQRKKHYSVRKYEPFTVVETDMPAAGLVTKESDKASQGGAFRKLAGFLFGGNAAGQKMSMTTPVITSDSGKMQFVLPLASAKDAPSPLPDSDVVVATVPGGLYASVRFSGRATQEECDAVKETLLSRMQGDGLTPGDESLLMRYNDPGVKGPFRRNEILIEIASGFDLWTVGSRE